MIKNYKKNKGYTLLFAVLVSGVMLTVGISILNISRKEFLLASSARESTYAFYAADSGLECAVFHDQNGDKFRSGVNGAGMQCAGQTPSRISNGLTDTTFNFKLPDPTDDEEGISDDPCVTVRVQKTTERDSVTGVDIEKTTIDAWGYNKGWNTNGSCRVGGIPSVNRVERALQYIYTE